MSKFTDWYFQPKEKELYPIPDRESDACNCEGCRCEKPEEKEKQLEFDFPLKIPLDYSVFKQ